MKRSIDCVPACMVEAGLWLLFWPKQLPMASQNGHVTFKHPALGVGTCIMNRSTPSTATLTPLLHLEDMCPLGIQKASQEGLTCRWRRGDRRGDGEHIGAGG